MILKEQRRSPTTQDNLVAALQTTLTAMGKVESSIFSAAMARLHDKNMAAWVTRAIMFNRSLNQLAGITACPVKLRDEVNHVVNHLCYAMCGPNFARLWADSDRSRNNHRTWIISGISDAHERQLQTLRQENADKLCELQVQHMQLVSKLHNHHKQTLQAKNREIKSLTESKHSRYLKENNLRLNHKQTLKDLRKEVKAEFQEKLNTVRQDIVQGHKNVIRKKDAELRVLKVQNRQLLADNKAMSGNEKKLERLGLKHKSVKAKIDNLKSKIKQLQPQKPDHQRKIANEALTSQVESLTLRISELTQAGKDTNVQHASDTSALKAEISSLQSQLTRVREESEVTELRGQLSKATHELTNVTRELAKAQQKAVAADAFLLMASEWRDKFADHSPTERPVSCSRFFFGDAEL